MLVAAATTALTSACGPVDVASRQMGPPPKCEVHGTVMSPEVVRVSSGEIVYQRDYGEFARTHFPHHGGVVLSGERGFRHEFEPEVRDFVCPACTRAYRDYWKEKTTGGAADD
jgi:hypothetical protein